jgi:hypothetical protein
MPSPPERCESSSTMASSWMRPPSGPQRESGKDVGAVCGYGVSVWGVGGDILGVFSCFPHSHIPIPQYAYRGLATHIMDEYFCHLDPASVREGDIVFVNSFLLCERPRLCFYLHTHHLCSRERKIGTFVLPRVHTRYICAPRSSGKSAIFVLLGAQARDMCAPGSTNAQYLCSR